jgi:Mrp family chromosome partitioning ATPase
VAKNFKVQIHDLTSSQRNNPAIVSSLYDNYSRANALSKGGAVAAQIQSSASVPSSPSSPKPVLVAVVAGIAGLLLGLIIAALREAFDRRLRGPKQIEADLGLPIVGHVREDALGSSPGSTNGKPPITELDLEAFRILRTNLEFMTPGKSIKTIAVTSALPEEGKTTVATSLAFALAVAGRRTLLVECDLRRPMLSQRLGVARSPGLTDFLAGTAQPQDVVRALRVGLRRNGGNGANAADGVNTGGGLACISAGTRTERPTELFGSEEFRQFVAEVRDVYDTVIFDTAPLLPVADTLQMLPAMDAVLVCLRASRTTRDQAIAARSALGRLPERPAGVVLTGARDRHDYSGYYPYAYSYSYREDDEEYAEHGKGRGRSSADRAEV